MADLIKIIPERLKEEASNVRSIKDSYSGIIGRLNNLVYIMSENWQGEAQQAFETKYQNHKKDIRMLEELMNQLSKEMDDIADKMHNADISFAAEIKRIS